MAHKNLQTILADLVKNLNEAEQLAFNATRWISISTPPGVARFSVRHKDIVTELAFLRAFLAWEVFLEESFILYLLGKKPPRGRPPYRYVAPTTREIAEQLLIPEGNRYIKWATVSLVASRAERFFRSGRPFSSALNSRTAMFAEIVKLRNAIAHWQSSAQDKFKDLVRNKTLTGTFPPNLTVGGFLSMRIPTSTPPVTFFEDYLNRVRIAADEIVPN